MGKAWRAALVVLLVLTIAPVGRAAPARRARKPVALKGITRIVGSEPAFVTVRLSKNVHLDNPLISDDWIQVRGAGDFVGFGLIGQGPVTSRDHIYLGGRLPESEDV